MTMEKTDWNALRDRAYECAKSHGWHEEKHDLKHYLMLAATEVAEAVQADRKGRRADRRAFEEYMETHDETAIKHAYPDYIAGTVEDELADVAIRLFDLAGVAGLDLSGMQSLLHKIEKRQENAHKLLDREFTVIAYELTDIITCRNLKQAVYFSLSLVLTWGDYLGIDMMWHIRQKMRYNETRAVQARQKILIFLTNEYMERETIEKAARDYAKGNAFCTNDMTSIFCEMMGLDKQIANGFVIGAQWRIDSVWHEADIEKPEPFRPILVEHHDGKFSVNMVAGGMKSCPMAWSRWAYVDDLLPGRKERK